MSSKYLTTYCICEKCQKKHEFSDDKNTPGVRLIRCQHFILKFIRNTDENNLRYLVSLKCCGCSIKQDIKKIDITLNYNKNEINLKYNKYSCCQNIIIIGAFYSEVETETINKIINLSDYNDFRHDNYNNDRDEQKRDERDLNNFNNLKFSQNNIIQNQMNNNNMFQFKESTILNENTINNNRYSSNEISNNGYVNIEQKELNNLKGCIENKESFDMSSNMTMKDFLMFMDINNIKMNNSSEMNNIIMQKNKNMNNNIMNNNINNMMNNNINNMMNNNMINNNIMNDNNMNGNMMNNNIMNNNMMNNNMMNNNMINNNIMNNNNMMNNNINNNNMMNNNNMNNMMNDNIMNNNRNNNMMRNNMSSSLNINDNNYNGKIINFKFQVLGRNYPIQERNDKLFGEVLKNFLLNYPEIQKSIHKDQKYLCSGSSVNLEKSLFENGIKDNSIIQIPYIKTLF